MQREGKLTGERRSYPIKVWKKKREIIIKDDDELLDIITDTFTELKAFDEKAEIKHAFNKLGIWEGEEIQPMQICDNRTLQILDTYEFYKNSPDKAFNPIPHIWFDSVIILNKIQPRLF